MPSVIRSPKQLGDAVRRHRRSLGVTQGQVGQEARLRQPTVSALESGSSGVKMETVFAVLAALDLELVMRPRTQASPDDIAKLF
jgi:HTH-type transcriptional regulator / antitoxin HipB